MQKGDISNFHTKLSIKKRTANHCLSVLSKIINWAEDQGIWPEGQKNPCYGIARYKEKKRERYLSDDELERLGAVLSDLHERKGANVYVIAAIRLLILTGARLNEIMTLKWGYIDAKRAVAVLPDSKTGGKEIPLNVFALDVLSNIPRLENNNFVLPGKVDKKHLVNIRKPWLRIRRLAGIEDVTLHDLRHSYGSFGMDEGGNLKTLGKIMGHSRIETTARYAHVRHTTRQQLSDAIGARIGEKLMGSNNTAVSTSIKMKKIRKIAKTINQNRQS